MSDQVKMKKMGRRKPKAHYRQVSKGLVCMMIQLRAVTDSAEMREHSAYALTSAVKRHTQGHQSILKTKISAMLTKRIKVLHFSQTVRGDMTRCTARSVP